MSSNFDVVIVGAGPYGIGAGTALRQVKGLSFRVFGEPMDFWKSHMPAGMLLRSPWAASHIGSEKNLTMDAFRDATRQNIPVPIPVEKFVEYGLWVQQQGVSDIDKRQVTRIDQEAGSFRITLADGQRYTSRKVVIAAGIGSFARRLPEFANLPPGFASHACDGSDVMRFAGKSVSVIGAGQSALEAAALMHEAGADVEVIARRPAIHWLTWKARFQKLGILSKVLYSPYDIGPAGVSRIVAVPELVKYFPRPVQDKFRTRALRPAGARWLRDRLSKVPLTTQRQVVSAEEKHGRIELRLDDGSSRTVDHVYQGTGYKVDVTRYPFLSSDIRDKIVQSNGFPIVNAGFESSVEGLHFLGAPTAWNFGPLMFFVCGTDFAARTLAQHIESGSEQKAAA